MIRIDTVSQSPQQVVLAMAGRLDRSEAAFVEQHLRQWLEKSPVLVLDLKHILSIDAAGMEVLQRLCGPRLVLQNAGPRLRLQLRSQGLEVQ